MKRFNHAFTVAFSIDSDNEGHAVSESELLEGLIERVNWLMKNQGEVIEAVGLPFDTYENYEVEND